MNEVPVHDVMRKYINLGAEAPRHAVAPMLTDIPIK
jgi:hypothetical protein